MYLNCSQALFWGLMQEWQSRKGIGKDGGWRGNENYCMIIAGSFLPSSFQSPCRSSTFLICSCLSLRQIVITCHFITVTLLNEAQNGFHPHAHGACSCLAKSHTSHNFLIKWSVHSLPEMKTLRKIMRTGNKTCNKRSSSDIFPICNTRHAVLNRKVQTIFYSCITSQGSTRNSRRELKSLSTSTFMIVL